MRLLRTDTGTIAFQPSKGPFGAFVTTSALIISLILMVMFGPVLLVGCVVSILLGKTEFPDALHRGARQLRDLRNN